MYKNIFISHASKNAWLIKELLELIRDVNPKAEVFCSSEPDIDPGEDYKKKIYQKLSKADMVIAIVSEEYWESRYCILELGSAYHRYYIEKAISIQPLLLPPLDKGMALANTPLVEVQITELAKPESLALFLHKIAAPEKEDCVDSLKLKMAEYSAMIRRFALKMTSLTREVACGAYLDERQDHPVFKDNIVRWKQTEPGKFVMEFYLSRLDYTPSFASIAMEYWDPIDFIEYLRFDTDAAFCFTIDNPDGALNYINVEFKFGETHVIYQTIRKDLDQGKNEISIPLLPMNHSPLGKINQICFVLVPEDLNAPDGKFIIDNIEVKFETKNILDITGT